MEVDVKKSDLLKALDKVSNFAAAEGAQLGFDADKILKNVYIESNDDRLRISATDQNKFGVCHVKAKVKKPGHISLPAKRLTAIIHDLDKEDISIIVANDDKNIAELKCASTTYRLFSNDKAAPPIQPSELDEAKVINLPNAFLRKGLRLTSFSMARDEQNRVLNGVCLVLEDKTLSFVTTDSKRLAKADFDLEKKVSENKQVIIPADSIGEFRQSIGEDGMSKINIDKSNITLEVGDSRFSSSIIEDDFPNFRQVIPQSYKYKITFDRNLLEDALKRISHVTDENSMSVTFDLSNDKLELICVNPDIGEARETLNVNYKGDDMKIVMNYRYCIDPLKVLDEDNICFAFNDEKSPCAFLAQETQFLAIIMPMRVS